jgi:pyridoxal phosphate enzyme (YggS family)
VTDITDHLAKIVERVARASERAPSPKSVTIVAVSKAQPAHAIMTAFHAGQRHFGESYVQEAAQKMSELAALPITWHFIGRIQANKTRPVAERFHWVHTIDRAEIAARLNAQRPELAAPLNVLIQVNQAREPQKAGVEPGAVRELARSILSLPRLKLRGLMTVPPAGESHWFGELAELASELGREGIELDTLSMGMSTDFEAAVAAGSNCVRIGTAIFGSRPSRRA